MRVNFATTIGAAVAISTYVHIAQPATGEPLQLPRFAEPLFDVDCGGFNPPAGCHNPRPRRKGMAPAAESNKKPKATNREKSLEVAPKQGNEK